MNSSWAEWLSSLIMPWFSAYMYVVDWVAHYSHSNATIVHVMLTGRQIVSSRSTETQHDCWVGVVAVSIVVLSAADTHGMLTTWTATRLSSSSEMAHMEVSSWQPSQIPVKKWPLKSEHNCDSTIRAYLLHLSYQFYTVMYNVSCVYLCHSLTRKSKSMSCKCCMVATQFIF